MIQAFFYFWAGQVVHVVAYFWMRAVQQFIFYNDYKEHFIFICIYVIIIIIILFFIIRYIFFLNIYYFIVF